MSNRGPIQTIDQLITKAKAIHGDRYDYSLVEHSVTSKKVTIVCKDHGKFEQNWNAHVHAKRGCWQCGIVKRQLSKRKGRQYWVDLANSIHNSMFDYSKCKLDTIHEKVELSCNKHGIFTVDMVSHVYDKSACPVCNKYTSKAELEVFEFVKSLGIDAISKDRKCLSGVEIDVFIPTKKLGIEINGIYWHSSRGRKGTLQERNYFASKRHVNKHNIASKKDIRLIQIWEDEWRDRKDATKLIIKAALGFGDKYNARQCDIGKVSKAIGNSFLDSFHVQGKCNGATDFYALSYKGILVAVMAFGISTSIRGNTSTWELMRFASIGRVRGGGSRLVKAFERDHAEVTCLVSYCDKRLFIGNSYKHFGFVESQHCRPDYMVVEGGHFYKRHHKSWAKKESLRKRYSLPLDDRTELEITDSLGLGRVYDCGKIKFVKTYGKL